MQRTLFLALTLFAATIAHAIPTKIDIAKLRGGITIDGDLSDSGWASARRVESFVEYFRGDNAAPPAKTVGFIVYDERYLYVGFHADDPRPAEIRAPYVDRDKVLGDQDYVAVLLDTRNDRRSAIAFRVNPRGIQTDSVVNDADGFEDFSPDFFYDAVARATPTGWSAELRIPLSSLRYPENEAQSWGVILMRNYPRDYRYIMANTPIPKSSNCFVCHASTLGGLYGLPTGGSVTMTPYTTASLDENRVSDNTLGFDLKWNATPTLTLDATLNPDFSQIEADVPQSTVNSRFALSFPEKRSFFLEGVDLLATPLRAVYTRTINAPAWGLRTTGQLGANAYTLLVAEDRGGGVTILPGPYGSEIVEQNARSRVLIGRVRRPIGSSFVGAIASAREVDDGSHNRLLGPDFLWKMNGRDLLVGQLLVSDTDGRGGHAGRMYFTRDANRYDLWASVRQLSPGFRADNGFVPQVGIRGSYTEAGARFYPKRFLSYLRLYGGVEYEEEYGGTAMTRRGVHPGFYFQGKWGSEGWMTLRAAESERVKGRVLDYSFVNFSLRAAPHRALPAMRIEGELGQRVDYLGGRLGNGGKLTLSGTIRPTEHLELQASSSREWLDLADGRLFTADVNWLKLTYTFTARSLIRITGQQSEVERRGKQHASRGLSALYGYKLNWQTVFFVGYGDPDADPRSVFMKVAYAFQR